MRDLFLQPFHAIHVMRDGSKSDVLMFNNKDEMRRVALYKLRKDQEENSQVPKYAYAILCATFDAGTRLMRVKTLETLYGHEK